MGETCNRKLEIYTTVSNQKTHQKTQFARRKYSIKKDFEDVNCIGDSSEQTVAFRSFAGECLHGTQDGPRPLSHFSPFIIYNQPTVLLCMTCGIEQASLNNLGINTIL
jgi:hypothetical protein